MCECYKIGGRFIAEDPDCPVHGTYAQSVQRRNESQIEHVTDLVIQVREMLMAGREDVQILEVVDSTIEALQSISLD